MLADCRNRRYPISLKHLKNCAMSIFSFGACFTHEKRLVKNNLFNSYTRAHTLSHGMFPFTRCTFQKQKSILCGFCCTVQ